MIPFSPASVMAAWKRLGKHLAQCARCQLTVRAVDAALRSVKAEKMLGSSFGAAAGRLPAVEALCIGRAECGDKRGILSIALPRTGRGAGRARYRAQEPAPV